MVDATPTLESKVLGTLGALATLTVVLAPIGIPLFWYAMRIEKEAADPDADQLSYSSL